MATNGLCHVIAREATLHWMGMARCWRALSAMKGEIMSVTSESADVDLVELAGAVKSDLPTPFLVIDRRRMLANIARMQSAVRSIGTELRPHVKAHKSAAIARAQLEAGACGVTCSTTDEVAAMITGGIPDVLLANVTIDPSRLRSLATSASRATVTAAVDSPEAVSRLEAVAGDLEVNVNVVIDCDIGMKRNGVRDMDEAVQLAETIRGAPHLTLNGVMGYEGHVVDIRDREERARKAVDAVMTAVEIARELRRLGYNASVLTGGSSATYDSSGAIEEMSELQAGSYALMDADYRQLVPEFEPALIVVATVLTSAKDGSVVVDVGSKRHAVDCGTPELLGYAANHEYTAEEHTVYTVTNGSAPRVGERVAVLPGHGCSTMNMYRYAVVAEAGRAVDAYTIDARDPLA